jgi:hypothetical protein
MTNDEMRMTNDEGNPKDEYRNDTQVITQSFFIRASSFAPASRPTACEFT